MYNAEYIAEYVIKYCNNKGYPISNLRLQKVLYFIQANFIMTSHRICFSNDMECWDYGPVVPEVYHKYRKYGSSSIPIEKKLVYRPNEKEFVFEEVDNNIVSGNDKQIIEDVIELTREKPVFELVRISHAQSPWKSNYQPGIKKKLPIRDMYEYFGGNTNGAE